MKRITIIIAALCAIWPPIQADAGCAVRCNRVVAVEQFVAVPAAIVTGVPVAAYAPTSYTYSPTPNVTVINNLNAADFAKAVVQELNGSSPSGVDPLPSPPSVPQAPQQPSAQPPNGPPAKANAEHESFIERYKKWYSTESPKFATAVSTNCAKCHAPGRNSQAVARIDLSNLAALTCEQRLAASRAVLAEKMPPGKPLGPELSGNVLTELVGK